MSVSVALYEQTLKQIAELSLSDQVRLNAELATMMKKEFKSPGKADKAKKAKGEKAEKAEKKPMAAGTAAWHAFVKHCRAVMPERFTECKSGPNFTAMAKIIKEEDADVYKNFVEEFKAEHSASAASSVVAEPVAEPVAKAAVLTKEEKIAKAKAAVAAAKPAKVEAKVEAKPAKVEAKEAKPAKKEVKKVAKVVAVEEEDDGMDDKIIDGVTYKMDRESLELFSIEADGTFGRHVGKFQPDGGPSGDQPILYKEDD